MTTWKHTNAIGWDDAGSDIGDDLPEGTTVQQLAIDQHNHGSFCTYPSQEAYEAFKAKLDAYRKDQVETLDIEMTMAAVGPIHVDVGN